MKSDAIWELLLKHSNIMIVIKLAQYSDLFVCSYENKKFITQVYVFSSFEFVASAAWSNNSPMIYLVAHYHAC